MTGKISSSKRAAALVAALTALAHAKNVKGQAVGLREPLFPRRDAATAIFGQPVSTFSYLTTGGRRVQGGEQDVFVQLGSRAGGHLFVGLDRRGRPVWVQGGGALRLNDALTGGVTIFAPTAGRQAFTPALLARLARHDIVIKFSPSIDTAGTLSANAVVIKGLNLGNLRASLRLGGGINAERNRSGELAASLEGRRWAADVGARLQRGGSPVGRGRLAVGGRHFYGAAQLEAGRGRDTTATVSIGGEFGTGRQHADRTRRRPHR